MAAISRPAFSVDTSNSTGTFVAALKDRCLDAFRHLYDDYNGALYTRIMKMTNDTEASQDILQNAFVKIWQNIGSFDPEKATVFTWMLTICKNEALDYFRSQRSAKRMLTKAYIGTVVTQENNSAPDKLEVSYFLKKLQPRDRVIIDLIYFHGFTHSQTSRLLALPEGTVKTRVRTLLKRWRPARDLT